jgi:nucleoside-diphosphate-sugar epimerase
MNRYQAPVISASTYLQYAPEDMRPWSRYAELKIQAQEKLLDASDLAGSNFVDFVLYDNFGGKRRGKFVDELLNSIESGSTLDATPGSQILNLTHLDDLADGLMTQMILMLTKSSIPDEKVMELKSSYNRTLREIVDDINETIDVPLNVNWGNLPYREKEVFEPWNTGLNSPDWWNPKSGFIPWVAALNSKRLQRRP